MKMHERSREVVAGPAIHKGGGSGSRVIKLYEAGPRIH